MYPQKEEILSYHLHPLNSSFFEGRHFIVVEHDHNSLTLMFPYLIAINVNMLYRYFQMCYLNLTLS